MLNVEKGAGEDSNLDSRSQSIHCKIKYKKA